ncbi:copper transporter 2-like [Impatiens glandulifera]|uniref:copper transporter 2-like n=1 Tax=Impatiens glandulifera TaxID=253017 RepID=UPI001FB06BE7|nr:copper transporter 2-like [Impatiens glandulifera]
MDMSPPSDMNMNMDMNNATMMKDMAMHMNFYWGREATILFPGWPNYNLGMYILSLFFVFFLAMAVEVLSNIPSRRFMNNSMIGGLVQTIIYTIRMALAYMVMLSVMSFNLGIFIVAVAGHGIGYFLIKFRQLTQQSQEAGNNNNNNNVLPK